MSRLKNLVDSLLEEYISESVSTIPAYLLDYPLDGSSLPFIPSDEELQEFYTIDLYRLTHGIFHSQLKRKIIRKSDQIDYLMQHSKADVVFQYLSDQLNTVASPDQWPFIVKQLDNFILTHRRLTDVFTNLAPKSLSSSSIRDILEHHSRTLVNIPTRIANVSHGSSRSKLTDNKHFVGAIFSAFETMITPSLPGYLLKLYGLIVSQLVLGGYVTETADYILHDLERFVPFTDDSSTCLWSTIGFHLKETCLESFILPILHRARHPLLIAILLEKPLLQTHQSTSRSLLNIFRRLIFVRYFPEGLLLRNIFGALCEIVLKDVKNDEAQTIVQLVNDKLGIPILRLWADVTAIQGNSVEQRIYTSQALCSWFGLFHGPTASVARVSDSLLLPEILTGISNHLTSPRMEIRTLGMAMGEWLMGLIELPHEGNKTEALKFSYEEIGEVKRLKPFFEPIVEFNEKHPVESDSNLFPAPLEKQEISVSTNHVKIPEELDSDDDPDSLMEALPRTPGHEKRSNRRPRYLRECLDGMLLSKPEDNLTSIACFTEAANLIHAHPQTARELATDLAHVFVHMEPPASPDESALQSHRHKALVALGMVAPKQCARYLTLEFSQPSCSLGQRQNIISAITDIACQLAASQPDPPTNNRIAPLLSEVNPRLEAKTRRFFKHRLPKSPTESTNSFGPIVADFFFPLLHTIPQLYSTSQSGTFAHQDASLLGNLIACLATMYACARHALVQKRMATDLLDLLPPLYRHSEPAVRRAVLIAVGTLVTTTPDALWLANPQLFALTGSSAGAIQLSVSCTPGFALPRWLRQCANTETDSECQMLASVGLSALVERVTELSL